MKRPQAAPRSRRFADAVGTTCLSVSLAMSFTGLSAGVGSAKPQALEVLQYLSPLPEKTYLNESQDRIIKKKSFKVGELPDATPVLNKETGFFAVLKPGQIDQSDYLNQLLSRADVNGLSILLPWSLINPSEDEYNWKPIDTALEAVKQHNKSLILRISTAGLNLSGNPDTPKWVLDANVKSMEYTAPDGKSYAMPLLWDTNYLAKWSNFVKDLGERYDSNTSIHSIGITGGGVLGGTSVIPPLATDGKSSKTAGAAFEEKLKKEHGMAPKQLVDHWKYVADLYPQAFPTARLNFDINPTTPNRAGQDMLDEISDYLVYRYGQRVYLTRQNVADGKHGFDQYRVLLKFRPDTVTGYQLPEGVKPLEFQKVCKNALDDGISFLELPGDVILSQDELVQKPLHHLLAHIGYQLVTQKATIPTEVRSGDPIKAAFQFTNLGSSSPYRPVRNLDKDVASSYRIQVELRDEKGKPVVISLHTPGVPTTHWLAGKPIVWEEELRMPNLEPGDYSVFLSVVDVDGKRKLNFLDATQKDKLEPASTVAIGTLKVLPAGAAPASSLGSAKEQKPQ